jgi:hypothetical protein
LAVVKASVEREFAGRMGLFFETLGATRSMGLIYGWLTVCEPEHQSITELAHQLGISKASVSTEIRQLEQAMMVERVDVHGSRQHHYRNIAGGWSQILRGRVGRLAAGMAAADFGLANIDPTHRGQIERLEEMRDFFAFIDNDLGDQLLRMWEGYRAKAKAARQDGTARMPAAAAAALTTDSDPPRLSS